MENNNYLITTSVAPHFDKSKVGSGDSRAYKKLNDDKFYIAVICTVIQKMYLYFPKLACIDEIGEIIISQNCLVQNITAPTVKYIISDLLYSVFFQENGCFRKYFSVHSILSWGYLSKITVLGHIKI